MTDIALPAQNKPASQGAVVEQTRAAAEVAAAVSVARNFPRSPEIATAAMRELCGRLAVAQKAFYEVPNRGTGLSVHIARELARIWGNIDYGVRELARDDIGGTSEMTVWAWDQEQNARNSRSFIQPHARMKNRQRQVLTDLGDIYLANQNTGARAVRECIFSVLPGWFLAEAEATLRRTLEVGDGAPIGERRTGAVARFGDLSVTRKQLETRLTKPLAEWSVGDIATLTRIYSSITIDGIGAGEFFPETAVTVPLKPVDEAHPDFVAEVSK
jgi:hypothetical protein